MSVKESQPEPKHFLQMTFGTKGGIQVDMDPSLRPVDEPSVSRLLGNATLALSALAHWCQDYLMGLHVEGARLAEMLQKMPDVEEGKAN